MIKDPYLDSDSNLPPVLQFLPLMSRHKRDRAAQVASEEAVEVARSRGTYAAPVSPGTGTAHCSLAPVLADDTTCRL